MNKIKWLGTAGFLAPFAAQAAGSSIVPPAPFGQPPAPITDINQVPWTVQAIVGWIFWGLIVLAVIMFLLAAYGYVTAAGEPEKVGKANKRMLYAAIAIVVALLANGLPALIGSFIAPSFNPTLQ